MLSTNNNNPNNPVNTNTNQQLSSMFSFLHSLLDWIGSLFMTKKPSRLLFVGLDNAGKTTMARWLCSSTIAQFAPTQTPTRTTAQIGNCTVDITDMGGHEHARKLWKDYFLGVDGVVFFISSTERDRFQESKQQLYGILSDEDISNVPILILGTKIDRPDACSEVELRQVLDVATTGKRLNEGNMTARPIEIFMTSILGGGPGVKESFEWFTEKIQQK